MYSLYSKPSFIFFFNLPTGAGPVTCTNHAVPSLTYCTLLRTAHVTYMFMLYSRRLETNCMFRDPFKDEVRYKMTSRLIHNQSFSRSLTHISSCVRFWYPKTLTTAEPQRLRFLRVLLAFCPSATYTFPPCFHLLNL